MIQGLIINTVIPLLYAYGMHQQKEKIINKCFHWLEELKGERNVIIRNFNAINIESKTAFDSQAVPLFLFHPVIFYFILFNFILFCVISRSARRSWSDRSRRLSPSSPRSPSRISPCQPRPMVRRVRTREVVIQRALRYRLKRNHHVWSQARRFQQEETQARRNN